MLVAGFCLLVIGALSFFIFFKKPDQQKNVEISEPKQPEPKKPAKPQPEKQKAKAKPKPVKIPDFEHENLVTVLKNHSDTVTCLAVSPNEKFVVSTSDDRSVCVWATKSFGKGNRHGKTAVVQDRAFACGVTPDGKGVSLALDFYNGCRVMKVTDSESMKVVQVAEMPVIDDAKNLTSVSFGHSCEARNTVKQVQHPWVVGLLLDPKNKNKQLIAVQSLQGAGKVLSGSPLDTGLGDVNSIKASGQFFGVCGFASQLKVYQVTDNTYTVKLAFSLSQTGQVFDFAFDQNTESGNWEMGAKICTLTKSKITVYETDERSAATKVLFQYDNPISDMKSFKPKMQFAYPNLVISHGADILIQNVETGAIEQEYKAVYPQVIRDAKVLHKSRLIITAGGRFIKVLKY